jgi:hypothetical protein
MIFLIVIGILLVVISSFGSEDKKEVSVSLGEYKRQLEGELADMCTRIRGVGKCYVSISFERGEQSTYKGSTLIETKPPKVLGVTVICKGADSDLVRGQIVNMMSSLFDIGTNRIAVLKLN